MKAFLLVCFFGVLSAQHNGGINLPHGHDLAVLVDHGFSRIDHNPKDGEVALAEFNEIIDIDDKNNDSCIDFQEFSSGVTNTIFFDVSQKMYLHFDPDNDDCLDVTEMSEEFNKIDHDGNGILSLHEFDHYYTQLLKHLYGPSHGHNGK